MGILQDLYLTQNFGKNGCLSVQKKCRLAGMNGDSW